MRNKFLDSLMQNKAANVVGDLQKEHLVEIWNGQALRSLQEKHLNLMKNYIPFCKNCVMNNYSEIDNLDGDREEIKRRMGF